MRPIKQAKTKHTTTRLSQVLIYQMCACTFFFIKELSNYRKK